jgi:hypothetical protein
MDKHGNSSFPFATQAKKIFCEDFFKFTMGKRDIGTTGLKHSPNCT